MLPVLLQIGGFDVNAYIFFLGVSFLLGTALMLWTNAASASPLPISGFIGVWIFLGAMQGARIWHVMESDGLSAWRDMLNPWVGGLAYHGGLVGGALAGIAYALLVRAPIGRLCDLCLPYLVLGEAITRVGCFLNGCCWGTPTGLPWAVSYPAGSFPHHSHLHAGLVGSGASGSLHVHPTQLYLSAALLLAFWGLRAVHLRRGAWVGATSAAFLLAQGAIRFVAEFLRGDTAPVVAWLTLPQVASVLLALGGLGLLLRIRGGFAAARREAAQEGATWD